MVDARSRPARRPWPAVPVDPRGEPDEPNEALVARPDRVEAAVAERIRLAAESEASEEALDAIVHRGDQQRTVTLSSLSAHHPRGFPL
jgi:hypothetical protein